MALAVSPLAPSPCIGVCEIDPLSGFCRGCARSAEEVALWRDATPSLRAAIWARLPARHAALGIRLARLPWTPSEILAFVEATLRDARGAWHLGPPGAVAEFRRDAGEPLSLTRGDTAIEALTPRAGLRLALTASTRAFALDDGRLLLVFPRVRLPAPGPATVAALGPDAEALRPADRATPRFDLGLARPGLRFTVRTASPALAAAAGRPLAGVVALLLAEQPPRVVETALGRAEIATPIPTTRGPATRLAAGNLADTPPGVDLPPAFALGATFVPE